MKMQSLRNYVKIMTLARFIPKSVNLNILGSHDLLLIRDMLQIGTFMLTCSMSQNNSFHLNITEYFFMAPKHSVIEGR